MKRFSFGGLILLFVLGASPGTLAQEPPAPQPAPAPAPAPSTPPAEAAAPAAEETPTAACSDCHDEAKAFVANPHARGAVTKGQVSNDACTPCHGDGTEHIAAGGDKTKIAVPRGRAGTDETCLLCHEVSTDKISRRDGMHANSEAVNCLSCHSIHHSDVRSPHLVAKPQLALCGTCHTQSASIRNKPFAHR